MFDVKKIYVELILGKCHKDPDLVLKILICWIRSRIRPKMDRIRNPVSKTDYIRLTEQDWLNKIGCARFSMPKYLTLLRMYICTLLVL